MKELELKFTDWGDGKLIHVVENLARKGCSRVYVYDA